MTVADIYRERCETWSDIVEHLPYMHDLVNDLDAQVVVELGVRSGNSTAALLDAVERTGGHLWSIDTASAPDLPTAKQWTFIQGDDLKVADQLPDEIDVLFIDTSHHYEHTLAELRTYGPRADWILLHDTELEHPHMVPATDPPYPVKAAIEAWCAETGRRWENRPNCYGLGTIWPEGV